jgi:hypothetical protein
MLFSYILQLFELPSRHLSRISFTNIPTGRGNTHRAGTEIPYPPSFHNIVQRIHDLFVRHIWIHSLDLENVDVRSQTFDARFHSIKNMFPRQANPIHHPSVIDGSGIHGKLRFTASTRTKSAFRHEHDILPWDVVRLECFGDDFFGAAVRIEIGLLASVSSPIWTQFLSLNVPYPKY